MKGIATVTLNAAIDASLTCPGFRAGDVNRVTTVERHAGGKGINVAAFSAARVQPVTALGFLGRDNVEPFEALFRAEGIVDGCRRIEGETRTNFKVLDPTTGDVTDINLPGPSIDAAAWAALQEDVAACSHDVIVLAGSLPKGVPDDAWATLIARAAGRFLALDASGAALARALAGAVKPSLIKPNRAELEELVGRPLPTRDDVVVAARALVEAGVETVVVSLGPEGALFLDAREALFAVPPPTRVVSTVGAGDAMLAGTLTALVEDLPLVERARRGTAFALGTLGCAGPVLPPRDVVDALLSSVRIEVL